MPKTATINIRVDPVTKSTAEKLFASFGITEKCFLLNVVKADNA